MAAYVAARLRDMGERPAILSRGYGRRDAADGVVVVRDPEGIRADLDRAGDEPLMLARQLDGVAVLVCSNRHLAGRLAEHHFDCTVHVLDDGFQHFPLERDADVVIVAREDLPLKGDLPPKGGSHLTLPFGHLREPVDALGAADAFIALDDAVVAGPNVWRARRRQQPVIAADPLASPPPPSGGPVIAVAGIAGPDAFFAGLKSAGWTLARELRFRDHHRYARKDVDAIAAAARETGARAVVTTEKDLVRLLPFRPFTPPLAYAPLAIEIESPATFDEWLRERVRAARPRS